MLLEETCSASKNNKSSSEFDRLRIQCHDTYKLQGDATCGSEVSDNPLGTGIRTPKER